jgi:hypothetical protein
LAVLKLAVLVSGVLALAKLGFLNFIGVLTLAVLECPHSFANNNKGLHISEKKLSHGKKVSFLGISGNNWFLIDTIWFLIFVFSYYFFQFPSCQLSRFEKKIL